MCPATPGHRSLMYNMHVMHFTEASFLCSAYSAGDQKPVRHIIERLIAFVNKHLSRKCLALVQYCMYYVCFANVQHVVYVSIFFLFRLFSITLCSWISAFPYTSLATLGCIHPHNTWLYITRTHAFEVSPFGSMCCQ